MTDLMTLVGSFTAVMLATWFIFSLLVITVYPLIRPLLLKWHPALSSNILLVLLSFPLLLSLCSTLMLFSPVLKGSLVSAHCHQDCQAHLPLLDNTLIIFSVLLLAGGILFSVAIKLLRNFHTSRTLLLQLGRLSEKREGWLLLSSDRCLVFTLGWWKSRIFLSSGLLQACTDQDMNIILAHEKAHALRRDNLRLMLARLFLLITPGYFNCRLMNDLDLFTESACDFHAAENSHCTDVAETLVRIQRLVPGHITLEGNPLVTAFTGSDTEKRVKWLLAGGTGKGWIQSGPILCLVFIAVLSSILVNPLHHMAEVLLTIFHNH